MRGTAVLTEETTDYWRWSIRADGRQIAEEYHPPGSAPDNNTWDCGLDYGELPEEMAEGAGI